MSRFSRAFDGALKSATPPISQAEAAAATGFHPSLVSRVLGGRSPLTPAHVSKLLGAIESEADREYCVMQFLLDCCPEDYREQLAVRVGKSGSAKARGSDKLTQDLATLEDLATDQPDLRRLISLLLSIASKADESAGSNGERSASVIDKMLAASATGKAPTPRRVKPAAGAKAS